MPRKRTEQPLGSRLELAGDVIKSVTTQGPAATAAAVAPAFAPELPSQEEPPPLVVENGSDVEEQHTAKREREKTVREVFRVPLEDAREFRAILAEINDILGPGIDKANVFRGFITLWNLSRREILETARSQEPIKPPNTREPTEVYAVDQLMQEIEASAFRRAQFRRR